MSVHRIFENLQTGNRWNICELSDRTSDGRGKKLLLQTDYKGQVIGNMVGYPEPNYFSYVFKKNCGMSPVKYRKQGGDADEG